VEETSACKWSSDRCSLKSPHQDTTNNSTLQRIVHIPLKAERSASILWPSLETTACSSSSNKNYNGTFYPCISFHCTDSGSGKECAQILNHESIVSPFRGFPHSHQLLRLTPFSVFVTAFSVTGADRQTSGVICGTNPGMCVEGLSQIRKLSLGTETVSQLLHTWLGRLVDCRDKEQVKREDYRILWSPTLRKQWLNRTATTAQLNS
jgi:hypothetical protein